MNKEINSVVGNVKNAIYSIVNQLVYIPFVTNMSNVFVTFFAGKGQKIAPKINSLSILTPELKPGAIQIQLLRSWCMPPFFCIQDRVGVYLPPQFIGESRTTQILKPFFLHLYFVFQSAFK